MIKKTFSEIDELQNKITSEIEIYKRAIADGKSFREVKIIYQRIKKLKQESLVLLEQANPSQESLKNE